MDTTEMIEQWFYSVPRERSICLPGQPFCLRTVKGMVRKSNQDVALVLAGHRFYQAGPFWGAVLCDGMGGLPYGTEAAILAAFVELEKELVFKDLDAFFEKFNIEKSDSKAAKKLNGFFGFSAYDAVAHFEKINLSAPEAANRHIPAFC